MMILPYSIMKSGLDTGSSGGHTRPMKLLAVLALVVLAWAVPAPLEDASAVGFFTDTATVDDPGQAVFVPGMRYCAHPSKGECRYWIEGRTSRPDWDHAMLACLQAGYSTRICDEAVNQDGEF